MDLILLGELLGQGNSKLVEVCDCVLGYLRAGCSPQEKGFLGVLNGFRRFLFDGSLTPRIARFASSVSVYI